MLKLPTSQQNLIKKGIKLTSNNLFKLPSVITQAISNIRSTSTSKPENDKIEEKTATINT